MPTCVEPWRMALIAGLLWCWASPSAADPVATPYGAVSLPLTLYKIPDTPIYYVIGRSGVPGAENEGHTSNAGFVVTEDGVVVFDALARRPGATACSSASAR